MKVLKLLGHNLFCIWWLSQLMLDLVTIKFDTGSCSYNNTESDYHRWYWIWWIPLQVCPGDTWIFSTHCPASTQTNPVQFPDPRSPIPGKRERYKRRLNLTWKSPAAFSSQGFQTTVSLRLVLVRLRLAPPSRPDIT